MNVLHDQASTFTMAVCAPTREEAELKSALPRLPTGLRFGRAVGKRGPFDPGQLEQVLVKVINIDPTGKIRLSRKALLGPDEGTAPPPKAEGASPAISSPSREPSMTRNPSSPIVTEDEIRRVTRLATEVAKIIRGKHKPMFTPHMDTGDNVIVINAAKVRVTGRKAEQKEYFRHTGYMGHERFIPFAAMLEKHPERVIEKAVFGMLPKSTLGRQKLRLKLKVYAGEQHPHTAQQPTVVNLKKSEKE